MLLLRSLYERIMNNPAHEELRLCYVFASIGGGGRNRPLLAVAVLVKSLVCKHNCTTKNIFLLCFILYMAKVYDKII